MTYKYKTRMPKLDSPKGLKGQALLLDKINRQREWIEFCESNGQSYTGENGPAIHNADLDALKKLENELEVRYGKS